MIKNPLFGATNGIERRHNVLSSLCCCSESGSSVRRPRLLSRRRLTEPKRMRATT
jgi:hypothetical protein